MRISKRFHPSKSKRASLPSERPSLGPARRTEGVRVQGRSARVVEIVLKATAEELGRVGFLALRIDDVAERSGVNKTTIYRRWASKEELVAACSSAWRSTKRCPTPARCAATCSRCSAPSPNAPRPPRDAVSCA